MAVLVSMAEGSRGTSCSHRRTQQPRDAAARFRPDTGKPGCMYATARHIPGVLPLGFPDCDPHGARRRPAPGAFP